MARPEPNLKPPPDRVFKGLRQFNCEAGLAIAGRRDRMAPRWAHWFPGDSLMDRFAVALSERYAIDMKEFAESVEFFQRVRRPMRAPVVMDLCCGHGLTGILFAIFERDVQSVLLVDRRRPESFERVYDAALSVAPWVAQKIEFRECEMEALTHETHQGVSLLGVHACGVRTDDILRVARCMRAPVAVMPCCHASVKYGERPKAFDETIGRELAIDIDRTYTLRADGYTVRWTVVPRAITAMNRVLIALPDSIEGAPG